MLVIAYILVFIRLGVRIAMKQKHLALSDALLVGGALCALGIIICDTISYRVGAMDGYNMAGVSMAMVEIDKACHLFWPARGLRRALPADLW